MGIWVGLVVRGVDNTRVRVEKVCEIEGLFYWRKCSLCSMFHIKNTKTKSYYRIFFGYKYMGIYSLFQAPRWSGPLIAKVRTQKLKRDETGKSRDGGNDYRLSLPSF